MRPWLPLLLVLLGCPSGSSGESSDPQQTTGDEDIMFPDEREAAAEPSHPATETVARGESALAEGNLDQAKALFEQAIAENDQDPRAHLNLGLVLELQNEYGPAEASYRSALSLDESFVEALNNLGLLLRDQERGAEAIPLLQRAVEIRGDFGEAWLNLALALEENGDLDNAEDAYRRAIRLRPRDGAARANLGILLLRKGNAEQAAIELRRALPLARGDAAALQAIGNGLRIAGQPAAAVQAMTSAIESREGGPTPALLSELALAHRANDDRPSAEATLRQAIELDASYATAHYLLAGMLAARGEYREAITHYQRYLRLDPRGPQADRARERLRAAQAASRR